MKIQLRKSLIVVCAALLNSYCSHDEKSIAPIASQLEIINITAIEPTSAIINSSIVSDGGSSVKSRGVCFSENLLPTTSDSKTIDGAGKGDFKSSIAGLDPGKTYHVRAYAINSVGTSYSNPITFTTPSLTLPTVLTVSVNSVNFPVAMSGGNVTLEGNTPVTERGICWSTNAAPTIADSKTSDGTGSGSFVSTMGSLNNELVYYVRAYATNSAGTAYGNSLRFTAIADADNNFYTTVTVGTQVWLKENLKTTKYINGDPIQRIGSAHSSDSEWNSLVSGAWCIQNDTIDDIYGKLYNWYAVTDSRKVCPINWHVPTETDWENLASYVGDYRFAGLALKEAGTDHWRAPNYGTNSSGFGALPGGIRWSTGFLNVGEYAEFWTSKDWTEVYGLSFGIQYFENSSSGLQAEKSYGFSVRCLKD